MSVLQGDKTFGGGGSLIGGFFLVEGNEYIYG